MNSDSPTPLDGSDEFPDGDYRLVRVSDMPVDGVITYNYEFQPRARSSTFEHDQRKRLFILTGPDGKTDRFRDNPARYLIVEPDTETGAMKPVTKHGQPVFIFLCREERLPAGAGG